MDALEYRVAKVEYKVEQLIYAVKDLCCMTDSAPEGFKERLESIYDQLNDL
jgi:hypothetical protein